MKNMVCFSGQDSQELAALCGLLSIESQSTTSFSQVMYLKNGSVGGILLPLNPNMLRGV